MTRSSTLITLVVLLALGPACACATVTVAHASPPAASPEAARPAAVGGSVTFTNRVATLEGGIGQAMIQKAQARILELDEQSKEPIWLRINSGGGSVEAGLVLIDTIGGIQSPIYCVVESKAYSMAAIILTFCDRRYALPHATIMLHEASYGTAGEDPSNRSRLDFLARYLDRLHIQIASRLEMPVDSYRARIRDAWWLLADEAAKAGVIDAVIGKIEYVEFALEQAEHKTTVTLQQTTHEIPPDLQRAKIPKRR